MRKITLLLLVVLSGTSFFQNAEIFAQNGQFGFTENLDKSPQTKIIFSVDPKNNGVNGIFLQENDLEAQLYILKGNCYRCEFYEGNIEGPFTVKASRIKPEKTSTLTILTMNNLMHKKVFDPGPFPPGSRYNLVRTKVRVIANQQGSLKLRVY